MYTYVHVYIQQNVVVGGSLPLGHLEEKSEKLGKGGNGTVFRYPLLNEEYAVKLVSQ